MKYSLRSLMIVALLGPPLLAGGITMATRLLAEPERETRSYIIKSDEVQYIAPGPEFKLYCEPGKSKDLEQAAP